MAADRAQLSKVEFQKLLAGGMAEVYMGAYTPSPVAVKMLMGTCVDTPLRVFAAMHRLLPDAPPQCHPGFRLRRVETSPNIMELLEGPSLPITCQLLGA